MIFGFNDGLDLAGSWVYAGFGMGWIWFDLFDGVWLEAFDFTNGSVLTLVFLGFVESEMPFAHPFCPDLLRSK